MTEHSKDAQGRKALGQTQAGRIVERVPIPLCGVMLAFSALGILLEPAAPWAHLACGTASCLALALIVAKIILFPRDVAAGLDNPVLAGVAGTFPMALMNLAVYLARLSWHAGFALWAAALALHAVLIVRFTTKFALAVQGVAGAGALVAGIAAFQTALAAVITMYVAVRYACFIFGKR